MAVAEPAGANDLARYSFDLFQNRLTSQPCQFGGLLRGDVRTSFAASTCFQSVAEERAPQSFRDMMRQPDEAPPATPAETAITAAFKERTFETIAPVATVPGPDYASAPALRMLVDPCRTLPPLPVIAKGSGLAGTAFDLRLDRLRIDVEGASVEILARGDIALFALGEAGDGERLYALQAGSYAEKPPSGGLIGWPDRNTDLRRGDRGILHLVLLPSCRYAGGIVFASGATMETTYNMTIRYPGAAADGSDIVRIQTRTRSYMTAATGTLARLIRIGDRVFFLTRRVGSVSRTVTIRSDRSATLYRAVRAGDLGDHGWQREDSLPRLTEAGLEFDVSEAASGAETEIWQIVREGDDVQARVWAPWPAKAKLKVVLPRN